MIVKKINNENKISFVIFFHCFIPLGNCPIKYKGYDYNNHKTCLRFEECLKTYKEAADICQTEGGDLIRVDSITKHSIMRAVVGSYNTKQPFLTSCVALIFNAKSLPGLRKP